MRICHALFCVILFVCCSNENESLTPPDANVAKGDLHILFVGNSLTYTNDLPVLIKEIGLKDGITITYSSLLFPNYSLEDHWNEGKVQMELQKGIYDLVIAQQGPSALPESQVLLLDYTTRLANACKQNKCKLALYMVWPSAARSFDLDNVIVSYTNAATSSQSLLCPAGLAWKNAWTTDSSLPLYSADNFHPSLTGSILAAITIYGSVQDKTNLDFIRLPEMSWKNYVSEPTLVVLKQAALKALDR